MTLALPLPAIASTNASTHNTPQLHGDKAALDEKSQAPLQVATAPITDLAAKKLESTLDQPKAKSLIERDVTTLKAAPAQVGSLNNHKVATHSGSIGEGVLVLILGIALVALGIILGLTVPVLLPFILFAAGAGAILMFVSLPFMGSQNI